MGRRRRWWSLLPGRARRRPSWLLWWPAVALVVFAVFVAPPAFGDGVYRGLPLVEILDAIRQVESGGRASPPDGDDGRAIGPYQIHRTYWQDALAHDPSIGGAYQDCRRRVYAERVIAAYMRRYVPEAWAARDTEVIARTHNGGPEGARRSGTLDYWERVKSALRAAQGNGP